jgi:hypothetical protein
MQRKTTVSDKKTPRTKPSTKPTITPIISAAIISTTVSTLPPTSIPTQTTTDNITTTINTTTTDIPTTTALGGKFKGCFRIKITVFNIFILHLFYLSSQMVLTGYFFAIYGQ